jgi:hypothetical protein
VGAGTFPALTLSVFYLQKPTSSTAISLTVQDAPTIGHTGGLKKAGPLLLVPEQLLKRRMSFLPRFGDLVLCFYADNFILNSQKIRLREIVG